jgi:hypothetical protein
MKLGCRKRVVFGDLRSLCLIRERERKRYLVREIEVKVPILSGTVNGKKGGG